MTNLDNQEYITSTMSINRVGHAILVFLILQSKHILYKWALYNNFSDDISLSTNDFGYSNNNLAIDQLKHFEKQSTKWQIRLYCLLIINSYGLYLTYQFQFFAKEYNIILFYLLSHFTYLTQPLDIGYFQFFKYYHT